MNNISFGVFSINIRDLLRICNIGIVDFLILYDIDSKYKIIDYIRDSSKYNLLINYRNLFNYFLANISISDRIKYKDIYKQISDIYDYLNNCSYTDIKIDKFLEDNYLLIIALYFYRYLRYREFYILKNDKYLFSIERFIFYIINKVKIEKLKNISINELLYSCDKKTLKIIREVIDLKNKLTKKI